MTDEHELQNALWIFPQGKIEHVDKRPLVFFKGAAFIASQVLEKIPQLYVVSIVSRIEYLDEQNPELFLSFREPRLVSRKEYTGANDLTAYMQKMTESHLDELSEKIRNRKLDDAVTLVKGSASVNRRSEAFRRFIGLDS